MDASRLDSIPLFATLPPADKQLIASLTDTLEVAAGEPVASQHEFGYSFFAIEDGTADVLVDGEPVAQLEPGDFFGEIALLCTGRRTAAVVAVTPLRLISMFEREFRQMELRVPEIARSLRQAAGRRLEAARA